MQNRKYTPSYQQGILPEDYIDYSGIRERSDERPDKLSRVMIECELASAWATCQRGRVGSLLVTQEFQVLLSARNGTPSNQLHCNELTSPDERCQFCIHSETNIINRAARRGISTAGLYIVTLKRPCLGCSNNIVEAGIRQIYYREDYDTDQQKGYVFAMLAKAGVDLIQVHVSEQEKEFSKFLEEWRTNWTT